MFKIKRDTYIKITHFFKNNSFWNLLLKFVYKIFPIIIFVSYPPLLAYSFFMRRNSFLKILFIPAAAFVTVTILRKLINRKRPYQIYEVEPVFHKDTKGKSMPSRHTLSAFIISFAALYLCIPIGAITLIMSVFIAASRVLAGVHFISDIICAVLLAMIFSLFFIIL